jgi:hypothetical protein
LPHFEATLEAQKQLLIQDYQDWEVIINDGSIDTTGRNCFKKCAS